MIYLKKKQIVLKKFLLKKKIWSYKKKKTYKSFQVKVESIKKFFKIFK